MSQAIEASDITATASGIVGDLARRLKAEGRMTQRLVSQPHPLVLMARQDDRIVIVSPAVAWDQGRAIFKPFASHFAAAKAALVLLGTPSPRGLDEALNRGLSGTVSSDPSVDELYVAIHNAFELIEARQRAEARGHWVNRYRYEIGEFFEIAQAITTERDVDKLLALILEKTRFITGADAGSMYVVEGDDPDIARRTLHFKLTQNDSVTFDSSEFSIPISERSMAGYAALHRTTLNIADVYRLPPKSPYGFDRSFDEKIGYRTRSVLTTPLLSRVGDVIGVLQLINKKVDASSKLIDAEEDVEGVIPFDKRSEDLLTTLASLAGIALENAILYEEQERMLEGFVRASVEAIEQRDPTTSGHSIRVAEMTVTLAQAVERQEVGTYRDVTFGGDDLRELQYASLLHDFGKIGVREQVLVKAKKLYPHDLLIIEQRFALALRSLEIAALRQRIEAVKARASAAEVERIERAFEEERHKLLAALETVREANEPKVLKGGDFAVIDEIARETFTDELGRQQPLLTPSEVECLCITRGSLTSTEYDEIRSHVSHTFEFLKTIPWGRKLRRVAQIAGAHHERLDGTGYPLRLHASEIPVQSKMMTISDIFDALTAADRPYKRAVPLTRALDILGMEVKENHIDGELVRIFIEAKVWESLEAPPR